MKLIATALAFALVAGMTTMVSAQQSGTAVSDTAASSPAALTDGEVRKIDKEARKLTLRHGPIRNLDMPGMTMVFQVQDSALLDQVKVGDKVKFTADKVAGAFTVTRIEMSN